MHPSLVSSPVILKEYEIRCDNCDKKLGVMVCTSNEFPKNIAVFSCSKCKRDTIRWQKIVYADKMEKQS